MAVRRVTRGLLLALLLAFGASIAVAPRTSLGAEPQGFEYFHTYAETEAAIDAAVAAKPGIARKFSIGQSAEGREIWAIALTGNIAAGEQGKPEVMVNGLIHARERASGEMALYLIRVLANKYGRNTKLGRRVTRILDRTVVYVVPMVNPDGAEFDFEGGTFHGWRKNRQPIPGSDELGVDLGRQFDFQWACCNTSGSDPSSITYRGPEPWFAPEVRAYRDFVNGRVVGGEQRITEILSLHSAARRVLWPYAYTTQDVPDTMATDDRAAFVKLARGMARRNGYTAQQRGDLAINDGDPDDWAYNEHGIFALALEMAKGSSRRYYPSLKELNADLARNRGAALWFLEQAGCPYSAAGLADDYCARTLGEPRYVESAYRPGVGQPQQAGCWCLIASTRAWLMHADPSLTITQSTVNDYVTPRDKDDWTDPSFDNYHICRKGTPSPSFAHDGRGQAWAMWQYATPDQSRGFNDYLSPSQSDMNWQIVRNIRATGEPVGIIAAGGRHSVLAVGYTTRTDPLGDATDNAILGVRVWDPWYGTGWGDWSGWPSGGFAPNSYVAISNWNSKYFLRDRHEGAYFWDSYVAILPTSTADPPSDSPPASYGEWTYEQLHNGQEPAPPPATSLSTSAAQPSISGAIAAGLRDNRLLNDPELGNLPASYAVGRAVTVEDLAGGQGYELVELTVAGQVRAVALVNRAADGYTFGELRPVTGGARLPTLTQMRSALTANGLSGTPRLMWGWTDERNPPFAPFLAGLDKSTGRLTLVTAHGLVDRSDLAAEVDAAR
ncbi:MAG TPA: M14 family metallopeptidase [Candidatus Limnocylindrales bacterium]|nr:M14 family metallopeptidase [Candidatus Limnocylindrales bacterium]